MLKLLKAAIPWCLAFVLLTVGYNVGYDKSDAKWSQEVHNEYIRKDDARKATQALVSDISADYQAKLKAAETNAARTLDDVHSDNKRLRVKVKSLTGQLDSRGRCQFDGEAELDDESAKRIIQVTQKGDAWIEALQRTVLTLQGKLKEAQSKSKE